MDASSTLRLFPGFLGRLQKIKTASTDSCTSNVPHEELLPKPQFRRNHAGEHVGGFVRDCPRLANWEVFW